MMDEDKQFCAVTGVEQHPNVSNNEFEIYYKIMNTEEAMRNISPSDRKVHINKTIVYQNKIKLETRDPRLLYTIYKLLGGLGYSVIELKEEDGLELDE